MLSPVNPSNPPPFVVTGDSLKSAVTYSVFHGDGLVGQAHVDGALPALARCLACAANPGGGSGSLQVLVDQVGAHADEQVQLAS